MESESDKPNAWKAIDCPKCGNKLHRVIVVSECWQYGYLDGNEIYDYDSTEDVNDTLYIQCPECLEKITDYVKW